MGRRLYLAGLTVVMAGTVASGTLTAAAAGGASRAGAAAGAWGRAIGLPGLGALNAGGGPAGVSSVSCASAGSCAAGGGYKDGHHHRQGFVAAERNGRWGAAIEVPGLGALNQGGYAHVSSVSCASAGSCAAGGHYKDGDGRRQGFVAVDRNGRWGTAIEVPGLGALNTGGYADVSSVSCAAAGSCTAGGFYSDRSHRFQDFVADERNGRWGTAIEVPGLGALNKIGDTSLVLGVVRRGGQLRGRRVLRRQQRPLPGVRGRRAERPLGHGDRGARPGGPEHGRGRPGPVGVVRLGGQLHGRRVLHHHQPRSAGVRGRRAERRLGQRRSRCPAWAP